MKNQWNNAEASKYADSPQKMRVYTSQLLGREPELVLHGGGNTSVKATTTDFFGKEVETLFVKGSGWDLATIEEEGFAPERLEVLKQLAALEHISDFDMVEQQRLALLNSKAPNASVEAILHAIIPFRYVDHTHANAVLAIMNTENGVERIQEVYGKSVLIIPYVMPGFALARKVYEVAKDIDWNNYEGMILMNHGVFTFSDNARESYDKMIEIATIAENYIKSKGADQLAEGDAEQNLHALAAMRKCVSRERGVPLIAKLDSSATAVGYSNISGIESFGTSGPLTPDHSIFAKRVPMISSGNPEEELENYAAAYQSYFERNAEDGLVSLDKAPRWAIWKKHGIVSFGLNTKNASVIGDIAAHTSKVIQRSNALGGWVPLPESDIFDVEYWELEQAKLKGNKSKPELEGKIAIVTGAASGIGKACVEDLLAKGVAVVGLDINPDVTALYNLSAYRGIVCDMTSSAGIANAIDETVAAYGGLDIVISNAGIFPSSDNIEDLNDEIWDRSIALNLSSHKNLLKHSIPFLKKGIDPAIVIIGTRNVSAPGPGASAYSVAKAGLTQLARVAALELAEHGIRVNVMHPDCVYDTGIWTDEVLQQRASDYGISIEAYKSRNLLKQPVASVEVAALASSMAGKLFAKTTGAQIPLDGGNDRVI